MSDRKSIDLGYLVIANKFHPSLKSPTPESVYLDRIIEAVEGEFVAQFFRQVEEVCDDFPSYCWTKSEIVQHLKRNETLDMNAIHSFFPSQHDWAATVGRLKINVSVEFEPICDLEEVEVVVKTKKVEIREL